MASEVPVSPVASTTSPPVVAVQVPEDSVGESRVSAPVNETVKAVFLMDSTLSWARVMATVFFYFAHFAS